MNLRHKSGPKGPLGDEGDAFRAKRGKNALGGMPHEKPRPTGAKAFALTARKKHLNSPNEDVSK